MIYVEHLCIISEALCKASMHTFGTVVRWKVRVMPDAGFVLF
jgi:hypothetical protein